MQTSVTAQSSTLTNRDDRALASVFCAYTVTASFWLLFATAVGVLMAYKYSAKLAWIGLALFNLAAVAGTIALDLG
jgi:cytochrome c oxidase cbb3-type subunit I